MNDLNNILGEDYKTFEKLIKFKYNKNLEEIKKLENDQKLLYQELNELFISFGLDVCIENMNRINEINEEIDNLSHVEERVAFDEKTKKADLLEELEKLYEENRNSSIGIGWYERQEKIKKKQLEIQKISEEISRNKTKISFKEQLLKEKEELYFGIDQSMLILDVEQRNKVYEIYVRNSELEKKIFEVKNANLSIEEEYKGILGNDDYINIFEEEKDEIKDEEKEYLNQEINDLKGQLGKKDQIIFELQRQISFNNNNLETPSNLEEKSDEVKDLETQLTQKDEQIAKLQEELNKKSENDKDENMQEQLNQKDQEIAELKKQLDLKNETEIQKNEYNKKMLEIVKKAKANDNEPYVNVKNDDVLFIDELRINKDYSWMNAANAYNTDKLNNESIENTTTNIIESSKNSEPIPINRNMLNNTINYAQLIKQQALNAFNGNNAIVDEEEIMDDWPEEISFSDKNKRTTSASKKIDKKTFNEAGAGFISSISKIGKSSKKLSTNIFNKLNQLKVKAGNIEILNNGKLQKNERKK